MSSRSYWRHIFEQEENIRKEIVQWTHVPVTSAADLKLKEEQLRKLHKQLDELAVEYSAAVRAAAAGDEPPTRGMRFKREKLTTPKGLHRSQKRELAILEALFDLGYTPTALPARVPGKSWVKSEVRTRLEGGSEFFTQSTFNKAWENLRNTKQIIEIKRP